MKGIPADPALQHMRFMQAFCDDLLARDYGAPRAKAVIEINKQSTRDGREDSNSRPVNDGE